MTSLQKQLAAIAVNSTHELDLKAQKAAYSKSLLFEPQVASVQSLETLFQICFEGFLELCALDSRFLTYQRTLFDTQSLKEDRVQLTVKENEDLSVVLESFLGLVGSRLLLKPAIKAVEWLVRRFQIHNFNTDFMIFTFLPYHELPIFVTLLSILPKQLSPQFKFLHPYMNTLKSPPRAALVYAAIHISTFHSSFNQYVLKISRAGFQYPTILSFWASISTQSVDGILNISSSGRQNVRQQREEDFLTRLLPIIDEALGMRNAVELALGCYMIIVVIAAKTDLDEKTIDALMLSIVTTWSKDIQNSGISCLGVLSNCKYSANLPKLVSRTLLKIDGLAEKISTLSEYQPFEGFAYALAVASLDYLDWTDYSTPVDIIKFALTSDVLDDPQKRTLFESVIRKSKQEAENSTVNLKLRTAFTQIFSVARDFPGLVSIIQDYANRDSTSIVQVERALCLSLRNVEVADMETSGPSEHSVNLLGTPTESHAKLISSIEDIVETSSFLAPTSSNFARFSSVFSQIALSPKAVQKFQHLNSLHVDRILDSPVFLSFFIMIVLSKSDFLTRFTALNIIEGHLSKLGAENIDFQALVPYSIIVLTDSNIKIRRKAASLLFTMKSIMESHRYNATDNNTNIWGSTGLYGDSTTKIAWMSSKDSVTLIHKVLCPVLEECISEPTQVSLVLRAALDSSKHGNETGNESQFRPKNTQKSSIFKFLCSHVDCMPLSFRANLLSILNETKKIAGQPRSKYLLPSLKNWVAYIDLHNQQSSPIDMTELDKQYLTIVRPADEEAVSFLIYLITCNDNKIRQALQTAAFSRLGKLWPLLDESKKRTLAIQLLAMAIPDYAESTKDFRQQGAIELIRKASMSSGCLALLLKEVIQEFEPVLQTRKVKRRRTSFKLEGKSDFHGAIDDKTLIRKLTLVLEMVDGSKCEADVELLEGLFGVIQIIQDYKSRSTSDLGYLQVLAISNLLSIMGKLQASSIAKLDASMIRTDLLVECIRKTSNPDVRNSALQLLGAFARYAPQSILHSIMPIFTLMASTTVQQGDEYSAHVVDETIREVIPLLATTLRKQNKDLVSAVAEILQSFGAAFKHIPSHRRLRLFVLLIESLGPEESLFAVIAILINGYPHDLQVSRFVCTLLSHFSATEALVSISKYLALVLDGLKATPELSKILLVRGPASEPNTEPIADLLRALPGFLQDRTLSLKFNKILEEHPGIADLVRPLFGSLMSQIIQIGKTASSRDKFHDMSQQTLRALINLLPPDVFVNLVTPLLDEENDTFCSDLLAIIRDRLETQKTFDVKSQASAIGLIPRLSRILKESNNVSLKGATIACIDQVTDKVGKLDPKAILEAANVLASDDALIGEGILPVLALHCLASMVEVLQNDYIPLVPKTLLGACNALRRSFHEKTYMTELHNAAQSFFTSIMTYVSIVVAEEPLRNLLELCHEAAVSPLGSIAVDARSNTLLQIAVQVHSTSFFSAMNATVASAFSQGFDALQEHMETVKLGIEQRSKSVITSNTPQLFELFLKIFDLRRRRLSSLFSEKFTDEEVELLETITIETMITMILKINDATFRPLFARFVSWATEDLETKDETDFVSRSTTLFNFAAVLSERLKSIITSYYNYLLDPTIRILEMSRVRNQHERILWKSTLAALSSFIRHDQDDFWQSPARFNKIMMPLISQLEKPPSRHHESIAITTIVEFASVVGSTDHHRDINYVLAKLAKADSSKTRLAAVRCQQSLTQKMGDEWLALLPEMLPVINELQEDDDEDVETETLHWIKTIEAILGESLDSMLQ